MLKIFEDLCPGKDPEDVLLDYAMSYFNDGEWPANVILAVLELNQPDRTFAIDVDGEDDPDLIGYGDVVDVTEGIDVAKARKEEVAALENRLAELKCQLVGC